MAFLTIMEPRACNRSQPVANGVTAKPAETSQNRCRRLRPVADWIPGRAGSRGSRARTRWRTMEAVLPDRCVPSAENAPIPCLSLRGSGATGQMYPRLTTKDGAFPFAASRQVGSRGVRRYDEGERARSIERMTAEEQKRLAVEAARGRTTARPSRRSSDRPMPPGQRDAHANPHGTPTSTQASNASASRHCCRRPDGLARPE
jgi:hypothetical protein